MPLSLLMGKDIKISIWKIPTEILVVMLKFVDQYGEILHPNNIGYFQSMNIIYLNLFRLILVPFSVS